MAMGDNSDPGSRFPSYLLCILSALLLALILYARLRLLDVPLERDEGEFAYMGQLLLKGFPPFTHAYTMKVPGVSLVYLPFVFLFGTAPLGIHLGLLVANVLSVILVYLLAKRVLDRNCALVSCTTYAILSLSQSVLGVFAHATHFVVLFSLAGFLLLLRYFDHQRMGLLFASGICFGVAITMKQHAVLLILCALVYLLRRAWPVREKKILAAGTAFFLLGAALPYALFLVWVLQTGVFDEFWFWTVRYASAYASSNTLEQGMHAFKLEFSVILDKEGPLWLLAGIGLITLGTRSGRQTDKGFLLGLLIFSWLAVCPGLVFRSHYFVLLLPAVALLVGAAVQAATHFIATRPKAACLQIIPVLVWVMAVSFGLFQERPYAFAWSPAEVSRLIYGANPFPEALQVARYLKAHTDPGARIAVLGSEPEILFYADRVSATGYIYMYGLMEKQPYAERMQMTMIQEIEQARPEYVVLVVVGTSWLMRPWSDRTVLIWGDKYLRESYELTGVVDRMDFGPARYFWDAEVKGHELPVSESYLCVYKRKGGL
jgi:4-amino-4-deoxy-L-arabinose transferase-like glycosyltransferase